MESICGVDCGKCPLRESCKGCKATNGRPFGGSCVAAQCYASSVEAAFEQYKHRLIEECNALTIEGMPEVTDLYALCGFFVNPEYPLPNGQKVKFLSDENVYLGCQV